MKQLLDEVLKAEAKDRVAFAVDSLELFRNNLRKNKVDEEVIERIIMNLTRFFVSADHDCTPFEHSFFKAITGIKLEYEDFYKLTNGGRDPEFVDSTLEFINGLDEETRNAAIAYGIAMLSSDLSYAHVEVELIDKLLSLQGDEKVTTDDEERAILQKSMEITEEILLSCVVPGDEKATEKNINDKFSQLTSKITNIQESKAIYLSFQKFKEMTFDKLMEIYKTVK
jgi:hypothetical protein